MRKHTPGPWSIEQFGHPYRVAEDVTITSYTEIHRNPLRIGRAYNISGRDETMANARLMASAPKMLAALERLSFAAFSRENVMGDPISLLNAKAELAAAAKAADEVVAEATETP